MVIIHCYLYINGGIDWFMDPLDGLEARVVVFNAMLNNISVISCYGENHQPAVSN
jgi:hypothetical protein